MAEGTRRLLRFLRYGGIGVAALAALVLLWGVLVEPRLIDVERETVSLPGLPAAWEGRRIALFADLQVGMWGANAGTSRRLVARLVADPPAAVLIAGDFLYEFGSDAKLAADIAEAVDIVRPLAQARIPTYAVLGNHDYGIIEKSDAKHTAMAARLVAALEAAGIRVMQNEAVALRLARRPTSPAPGAAAAGVLYLAGVGSNWAGEDDPMRAVGHVPTGAPYLVFMHNPRSYERMPAGAAPIAFAAHTHGGQVRIPFTPEWTWLTFVRDDAVHADGWTHGDFGAAGNHLYVNRGIGFSYVPVRIACPPELTMITLERSATTEAGTGADP
jgi:predicted MPP superfamily phosphohydrolase